MNEKELRLSFSGSRRTHDDLAQDLQKFLDNGGVIQKFPPRASGRDPKGRLGKHIVINREKSKAYKRNM